MQTELKKILYAEDEEDIALVVGMTLEELGGFEIRHCHCGQEALDAFSDFSPQLIVLDVMMPGMDGPETLANLRKLPCAAEIPIIFMTAKAQAHEQQRYLELGAIGVITKPFDPMTLSESITELWEKHEQSQMAS
jgi:CheY-like chemotaxis protein